MNIKVEAIKVQQIGNVSIMRLKRWELTKNGVSDYATALPLKSMAYSSVGSLVVPADAAIMTKLYDGENGFKNMYLRVDIDEGGETHVASIVEGETLISAGELSAGNHENYPAKIAEGTVAGAPIADQTIGRINESEIIKTM